MHPRASEATSTARSTNTSESKQQPCNCAHRNSGDSCSRHYLGQVRFLKAVLRGECFNLVNFKKSSPKMRLSLDMWSCERVVFTFTV
eukprot:1365607-Amphidinium_carterae.3